MEKEHRERIDHLIDAIDEARIYAGAEFEALCNEKKFETAEMFCMIRDVLKAQSNCLKDLNNNVLD